MGAALAGSTLFGCKGRTTSDEETKTYGANVENYRMPALFLPHGGGPWPIMPAGSLGPAGTWDRMRTYLQELGSIPKQTPTAILVVSAHWEEKEPTIQSGMKPPLLYDYYGFPKETYDVKWAADGAPAIADEIASKLSRAGINSQMDANRGFDHGAFVPLLVTYPDPYIPTLQLSLKKGLNPRAHFEIGRALESLRDEGVLILGSGMSYHNLRMMMRGPRDQVLDESKAFDEWLVASCTEEPSKVEQALIEWERAPKARACHPREEHLLPLMVVAGAAGNDRAVAPYRDVVMNSHISALHFGV